jgi:membrane protein
MDRPLADIPTTDLVKQLAAQSVELAEKEVELTKAEVHEEAKQDEHVAEGIGVSTVCALIGLQGLVIAAVFGLARLLPDWGAALVVAGLGIGASAIAALLVRHRGAKLLPRTQHIVSGEMRWLKKQLP